MVGARVKDHYVKLAKERQQVHGGTAPGREKTLVENLPQVFDAGKARDQAGKAVGVSGKMAAGQKRLGLLDRAQGQE